jgi:hypothetical protein
MFQLRDELEAGVPILYSTGAHTGEAITHFSFVKSCYGRWPMIKVFGKDCCVAQLVCLLQFGHAPRSPQHTDGVEHSKSCLHLQSLVLGALVAFFPALYFTNISHHDEQKSEEIRNNRAMAMLPIHYSIAMFSLLEDSGYINKYVYPEEFWETSAVCMSSNNKSALDVSCVRNTFKERNFRVFSDQSRPRFPECATDVGSASMVFIAF